jgi:hypothetical protein
MTESRQTRFAHDRVRPPVPGARLLPWAGPDGKPAFLVAGGDGGVIARAADEREEMITRTAAVLIRHAADLLGGEATPDQLRFTVRELHESLSDVLCVAVSREMRLAHAASVAPERAR